MSVFVGCEEVGVDDVELEVWFEAVVGLGSTGPGFVFPGGRGEVSVVGEMVEGLLGVLDKLEMLWPGLEGVVFNKPVTPNMGLLSELAFSMLAGTLVAGNNEPLLALGLLSKGLSVNRLCRLGVLGVLPGQPAFAIELAVLGGTPLALNVQ